MVMETLIEEIYKIDHSVLLFIQENLRAAGLTPIMQGVSLTVNLGLVWIILSVGLACFKKTRMIGFIMLSSLAFGLCVNNIAVKNIVARARPYDTYSDLFPLITKPKDTSFASGHTTASFAAAGVLARFLNRSLAAAAIAYAVLVAFSRMYLGVHYPSDVIAGCIIGTVGSVVVYKLYEKKFDLEPYKLGRRKDEKS